MSDGRVGIRVKGANRLRRTLKQAGVDVKQLKAVNRAAAEIAARAAAAKAPVGGPYKPTGKRGRPKKPGKLKASIRPFATQRAGVIKGGYTGRVPYAGVIHYGWPKRNIRPNPFAAEAAKATEPIWTKEYERKVNEVIRSVKGK